MEKIDANTDFEDLEIIDYPYLGFGKKPKSKKYPTEEDLEKIIGG